MNRSARRHVRGLVTWAVCLSQLFWSVGCRQATGSGAGSGAHASTAAGATAGVNMGQIVYDLLHHGYETAGETGKMAALEARRSDFIDAVNRILPSDVSGNLWPTLMGLLPLVDDGTVERAAADVDAIIVDLLADPAALDGLVALMGATQGGAPQKAGADHSQNVMISRLLAYPELEDLARAIMELVRDHDGVDDQGQPNGERNLLGDVQALLSRQLLAYQPSTGTSGAATSIDLSALAGTLLAERPLSAFPDLGAPAWAVRRDRHGNPKVVADPATGKLPFPFIDRDADGVADVDVNGLPLDADNHLISIAPFGNDGTRDSFGRALAPGGALYYEYFDAKRTLLSEVLLLVGELLQRDVAGNAVKVVDAVTDRVRHDNGTSDPADDYETLSPTSPILDLTHAQFELTKRAPLCDLLRGLAEVVKRDPAKFAEMVDDLVVALHKAQQAAANAPAAGGNQAMLDQLLPLVEDALRPRGRNNQSAVRALLQAFNSEQKRLQNLPASFALMMRYHDYGKRIPADATHKSVMQRVLEMMERADGCHVIGASGSGNMAEFYLDAMAGNASVFGINMSIGTINKLVDVAIIRQVLCSAIREEDVRALKDFADTGALEAMKPICRVFSQRGETALLKNIMLALGDHYDAAMRPTEPMAVAILESGAVEKLFEAIDAMTQVRVPGSTEYVADVLADTLQVVVDSSAPVYDRHGRRHKTLMHLLQAPLAELKTKAQQKGVAAEMDALMSALVEVVLATYTDAQGVERWKWGGLKSALGDVLEFAAGAIPQDPAARASWAYDQQHHMEQLLAGRDVITALDLLKTIAASPQKAVINRAIANFFTPRKNAAEDAFGAVLGVLADGLARKPGGTVTIDPAAVAAVAHFLGRQLDPALGRFDGILDLVRKLIRADDGMLILRLARNAYSMGPNGTDTPAIAVIQSVLADVNAAGTSGPMTRADLEATLRKAHDFINDPVEGLPRFIQRIKGRHTAA